MPLPDNAKLLLVIDHGSRAGNAFLMSVFDQHDEILCCPYLLYFYSSLVTHFGDTDHYPSRDALEFLQHHRYAGVLYNDLNSQTEGLLNIIGAEKDASIDREIFRRVVREGFAERPVIQRRRLVEIFFEALALSTHRDLSKVKYFVLSDAISLREESPLHRYSCRSIWAAASDFPDFHLISLSRDPRAQLCSCRHQNINLNGNAYGARYGTFLMRIRELLTLKFYPENFAFLFWLLYGLQSFLSIRQVREKLGTQCYLLRNEDMNLRFVKTMEQFCAHFGVSLNPKWRDPNYIPTMMGLPWKGTGAFIPSKYPAGTKFKLENETQTTIKKSIGPNPHVTTRWRSQMNSAEITVSSYVYREELQSHFFDIETAPAPSFAAFLVALLALTKGEGYRVDSSWPEKIAYLFWWPSYWMLSRIATLRSLVKMKFFRLSLPLQ